MAWATTEDGLRLSMKSLHDAFGLRRGLTICNGKSTWRRGNSEPHSSIGYTINLGGPEPYIELDYKWRDEPVKYKIRMVTTTPRYGGERWWFVCPFTHQRCSVLYSPGGQRYFASRKAFGLKYESQKEDYWNRLMRRYHKKLDASGCEWGEPWFPKPKGMHCRTYERRLAELEKLSYALDMRLLEFGLAIHPH